MTISYTQVTTAALCSLLLIGCASIPSDDARIFQQTQIEADSAQFETARFLATSEFIAPNLLESALYTVDPRTYNDGETNTYKVETPDHVYVVKGTAEAINLFREIEVIDLLRQQSMIGTAKDAVAARLANFVNTPARAVDAVARHANRVESAKDAMFFLPSGAAAIASNLVDGISEVGVTGLRLTENAANTDCEIYQCAKDVSEDAWYAVNSVLGKHTDVKNLHLKHGTDPESDNEVLRRAVDRLTYTEAYSGTAFKFALGAASLPVVAQTATGIGYYNNAEYLSRYQDALALETRDKKRLATWGAKAGVIENFYGNDAFTRPMRSALVASLSLGAFEDVRVDLIDLASQVSDRDDAGNILKEYAYMGRLDVAEGARVSLINGSFPRVTTQAGTIIIPLAADYAMWTVKASSLVKEINANITSSSNLHAVQIHLIGQSSPRFKLESRKLGTEVVDIPS